MKVASLIDSIRSLPPYDTCIRLLNTLIFTRWHLQGKPVPPPHIVKQKKILSMARAHHITTFIETGTYRGDMVAAVKNSFRQIHSIELSNDLYKRASQKFSDQLHIHIHHGDSGVMLSQIIEKLKAPALFWLDGHYSGQSTSRSQTNTPIMRELEQIFAAGTFNHVILIDDARCFNGTHDYPDIAELRDFILSYRPNADITVEDDIIMVVPPPFEHLR